MELPDWLGQVVSITVGDALRWREGLPRPDALVPIGSTSGRDSQDGALCKSEESALDSEFKGRNYWIGSRRCPQGNAPRVDVIRFLASVIGRIHISEFIYDQRELNDTGTRWFS